MLLFFTFSDCVFTRGNGVTLSLNLLQIMTLFLKTCCSQPNYVVCSLTVWSFKRKLSYCLSMILQSSVSLCPFGILHIWHYSFVLLLHCVCFYVTVVWCQKYWLTKGKWPLKSEYRATEELQSAFVKIEWVHKILK